jgi:hypothetical protein
MHVSSNNARVLVTAVNGMIGFSLKTQHKTERELRCRWATTVPVPQISRALHVERSCGEARKTIVAAVTGHMRTLLYVALLIGAAPQATAEVFAYESGGRQFEAEVTPESLTLREKRDNAATDAISLACPLGSAVRANVISAGGSGSKVCLVFSRQQCNVDDARGRGASGSFRCIEFSDIKQAEALAGLINAGPQPEVAKEPVTPSAVVPQPPESAGSRTAAKSGSPPAAPSTPKAARAFNAPSAPASKSGTAVRKPNAPAGAATDKSAVTNQNAQPPRNPGAEVPTPAAADRGNETRPADKRGEIERQSLRWAVPG